MGGDAFQTILWGPAAWGLKDKILGKSPSVSNTAPATVVEDQKKQKKSRPALFETAGGITGEELMSGQVGRRSTLLGN